MKKTRNQLIRENEQLRKELEKYRGKPGQTKREEKNAYNEVADSVFLHDADSYFQFLKKSFLESGAYKKYKNLSRRIRPIRYIVIFFKWLLRALSWIQASALLLVLAALAIALLPIILFAFFFIVLVVKIDASKKLFIDRDAFYQKSVMIFFRSSLPSRFFLENARSFSENSAVIIVGTSYVFRKNKKTRFALNRATLYQKIILVREHYYFLLKNKYFKNAKNVTFVY